MEILLSQSSMFIIRYVAWILGWLMNGIYEVLNMMGIANMALCITLFTIIIYVILTPVQIKQQKSSKIMSAIQPELQAIQKKYQGKKDTASQQKMQEETMAVQAKYGVSMTGSCLPMMIQLPMLFALYQVILYIPGYVTKIKEMFSGVAEQMVNVAGYEDIISNFVSENSVRLYGSGEYTVDRVIDFLYVLKPSQWTQLQSISEFSAIKTDMVTAAAQSARFNSFFGINISDSPWDAIQTGVQAIAGGNATPILVMGLIAGIAIPVLAWFTQWINLKLMPQQASTTGDDSMARQMNTMNNVMPIFSAFICMTFSMGIGIYWIVGAVVRGIQQVIINRSIGKIDIEEMKRVAEEKNQKKAEKSKDYVNNITQNARTNVKRIQNEKSNGKDIDSSQFYKNAEDLNPDSITAKANWVKSFDEKNKKNGK